MVRGLRRDPQTSGLAPGMHFTPSPHMLFERKFGGQEGT